VAIIMVMSFAAIATPTTSAASALSARTATNCGPAAYLPPGSYNGVNFFKVTARNTTCHTALMVANAMLHQFGPARVYHIQGFVCRYVDFRPNPLKDALVRCTRGRAVVLGYNDGE
jgi:hypothetical protein